MAEVLQFDAQQSVPIILFFESTSSYGLLNALLSDKKKNKQEEVRKLEGSNFGCPSFGFNDGIILFLQRLLFRSYQQNRSIKEQFVLFEKSGILDSIVTLIRTLGPLSDLSPKGFLSLLVIVYDTILSDFLELFKLVYQEQVLSAICGLIKESQWLALKEWPLCYGGGSDCVSLITVQLIRLFNLPFIKPSYE